VRPDEDDHPPVDRRGHRLSDDCREIHTPALGLEERGRRLVRDPGGLAFVVGGANLCAQHLKKISARRAGWGYSAVTLASFTVTLFVGLLKVGVTSDNPDYPWSGQHQKEGSALWWLFEYAYQPLIGTMFALLAFYVASAAFRAFRAKNTEATMLLGAAFIVLLGRTYAGTWLTSAVPEDYSALTFRASRRSS